MSLALFLFLILSNLLFAKSIFVDVDVLKEHDKLEAEDVFLKSIHNCVFSDKRISKENQNHWEEIFGSLKNERNLKHKVALRSLELTSIRKDDVIQYLNKNSSQIVNYKIPESVIVCMMGQAGDDPSLLFNSFLIALEPKSYCEGFTFGVFDTIAYKGNRFHINPHSIKDLKDEASLPLNELEEIRSHLKSLFNLTYEELQKIEIIGQRLENKFLYFAYVKKDEIGFLKTTEDTFLTWRKPKKESGVIVKYNRWIKESELTAVLQTRNEKSLLIFLKNGLLKFPL